jgi:RimJ/RimL family protein N-acetyltransferase
VAIVASDDLTYLRKVSKDDLTVYYRWYKDREVQRFMGNPAWDPGISEDDYRHIFLRKHLLQTGVSITFTVCLRCNGSQVGLVDLYDIDRENGRCDMGIVVGEKKQWRKGIASSAIRLTVSYVFDTTDLSAIYCSILVGNGPSIGLFEKCGFAFETATLKAGFRFLRYRLDRPGGPGERQDSRVDDTRDSTVPGSS